MSTTAVIVPVMAVIVIAAIVLVAVLAFPYRGRSVPAQIWGAASLDRALAALAAQMGVGHHPDVEPVSTRLSTLSSSSAPRD